jgi:hypothetical protein
MTNDDPIDQWLKNNIQDPEALEAHSSLENALTRVIHQFIESDTEISDTEATWMTALSISYLYNFLRDNPLQIDALKKTYTDFKQSRDIRKLEQLLQK